MQVNLFNEQQDLQIPFNQVESAVAEIISFEGQKTDEVNIYFVDEETITKLHEEYFDDPTPTDCISFPIDSDDQTIGTHLLGEVFVCPKTAIDFAKANNKNAYDELLLYITHGLLHLMGYDDLEEIDRTKMRQAEQRHLDNLRAKQLEIK